MEETELFFFCDKEKLQNKGEIDGNTSRCTERFIWYQTENCV